MKLEEAIKSGKPFRRKCWTSRGYVIVRDSFFINVADGTTAYFNPEPILATDWEIEEKKVTVTREQLAKAWKRSIHQDDDGLLYGFSDVVLSNLTKELGL